ncbi:MAG: GntR family transcriptional regulator [Bacteroidales bacterium]
MEFKDHQAIYLQIAESVCEKILNGIWKEEDRIPSVRELGTTLGVNPNTVARTYEHLQQREIIYNKRGIGFFVTPGARREILTSQRKHFLKEELPGFFKKLDLLGITIKEIEDFYNKHTQ